MRTEKMVNEAVNRMQRVGLYDFPEPEESVIRYFKNDGKVFVSKPAQGNRVGVLYPLNAAEQALVDEFESQYDMLVYHVIRNEMEIGVCYSFLYVENNEEDWEMSNEDLEGIDPQNSYLGRAYPMAYVVNVGYVSENETDLSDNFGEFGSIAIENGMGGLVRKG